MDKAEQTMIENLRKSTGRSLDDWIAVVRGSSLHKHGEIIKLLKEEHGLTHGYANFITHKAKGSDAGSAETPDALIDDQYKGKENLRPIYDRLISEVRKFGLDVEIAPKKSYVSLRRKKQFALFQPSTKSRLDVGLNLKNVEPEGRLEASGSFNSMCTHRIRIEAAADVDKTVIGWLKAGYDDAG